MASGQPTSEVSRHATFAEDVYLVFAALPEDEVATIQVFVKPLVRWVWIGGIVMFFGTAITLVPGRRELKLVEKAREEKLRAIKANKKYEVA